MRVNARNVSTGGSKLTGPWIRFSRFCKLNEDYHCSRRILPVPPTRGGAIEKSGFPSRKNLLPVTTKSPSSPAHFHNSQGRNC